MRKLLPVATQTQEHLRNIRAFEAQQVMCLFGDSKDILEVGAGDGYQSSIFASMGHQVKAVDIIPSSSDLNYISHSGYREHRYYPVDDYDGIHLPFPDNTFDIVYSSSVLEHVKDKSKLLSEMKRVLKRSGLMVHVLPNARWRILSSLTYCYKRVALRLPFSIPLRHGELGNILTEIYFFSDYWWSEHFKKAGFQLKDKRYNNLVYTGDSILDSRLSLRARNILSTFIGSSCTIYKLKVIK